MTGIMPGPDRAFGWPSDARWEVAHVGENQTWRVTFGNETWAAKLYRPGVERQTVDAEAAWWRVLSGVDPRVTSVFEKVWMATPWMGDHPPDRNWGSLGRLVRDVHIRAAAVSDGPDWVGWKRPAYTRAELIDRPIEALLQAPFLEAADRERIETLARRTPDPATLSETGFVHMDAHFGNVVQTATGWRLIDLEECGFGPLALDLGVSRYHLRARGDLALWADVAAGYGGLAQDESAVALGTALRILYVLGKIPARLDVPKIAANPLGLVRRHLSYVEAELDLVHSR